MMPDGAGQAGGWTTGGTGVGVGVGVGAAGELAVIEEDCPLLV
jgi:hypothetical protein